MVIPFSFWKAQAASGGESLLQTNGNADWIDSLNFTYYTYLAAEFTAGGNYNVSRIDALMVGPGSPSAGTFVAEIWTKSGASPGTKVGTSSSAVDRTTINNASPAYISFTGVAATLTSGTSYYVVLRTSSTTGHDWIRQAGGTTMKASDSSGATWDSVGTGTLGFRLYGTP